MASWNVLLKREGYHTISPAFSHIRPVCSGRSRTLVYCCRPPWSLFFCEQNPRIKLVRWCNPIHRGIEVTLDQFLQDTEEEKIEITTYITCNITITWVKLSLLFAAVHLCLSITWLCHPTLGMRPPAAAVTTSVSFIVATAATNVAVVAVVPRRVADSVVVIVVAVLIIVVFCRCSVVAATAAAIVQSPPPLPSRSSRCQPPPPPPPPPSRSRRNRKVAAAAAIMLLLPSCPCCNLAVTAAAELFLFDCCVCLPPPLWHLRHHLRRLRRSLW